MPEPTPLEAALAEACTFATTYGVQSALSPADFALQRSEPGVTHATYVDAGHVVSVIVDGHGHAEFAVGDVFWVHDDFDEGASDYCGMPELPGCVDVYLPGDGPADREVQV